MLVEPAELLGIRKEPDQPLHASEVLIKSKGLPDSEATWELYHNISTLFSDFHLEDKVSLVGAGIVIEERWPISLIKYMHSRKRKE